jgi:hypothetical protein
MAKRINETWGGRYEVAEYDRKGRFVRALAYFDSYAAASAFIRGDHTALPESIDIPEVTP